MCAETVNAIGTKRGAHQYEVSLVSILNIFKRKRMSFDYLLILGLWQAKFAKKVGGALRLLCGIGPDGTRYNETCYAVEMRALRNHKEYPSSCPVVVLPLATPHTVCSKPL